MTLTTRPNDETYLASIYRMHATLFRQSAALVSATFDTPPSISPRSYLAVPFYFLVSHAMELLLKSALLKRGVGEAALRNHEVRHNLGAMMTQLEAMGLTITHQTATVVRAMSDQHENHALRYSALVDDGKPTYMPPPAMIEDTLDELLLLTRISTQGR